LQLTQAKTLVRKPELLEFRRVPVSRILWLHTSTGIL